MRPSRPTLSDSVIKSKRTKFSVPQLGAYRGFDSSDAYTDAQVEDFKREWRYAHPATTRFWRALERAAHRTVFTCRPDDLDSKLAFSFDDDRLLLMLPSGRNLVYPQARLVAGKFEGTRELVLKTMRGAAGPTARPGMDTTVSKWVVSRVSSSYAQSQALSRATSYPSAQAKIARPLTCEKTSSVVSR